MRDDGGLDQAVGSEHQEKWVLSGRVRRKLHENGCTTHGGRERGLQDVRPAFWILTTRQM